MKDKRLKQLDGSRFRIENNLGVSATLFANNDVPVETAAIDELLDLLQLQRTIEQLSERSPGFLPAEARLERVAITPDFHKGAGIPIGTVMSTRGFVVPAAVGNDVNCGMRMHVTTLSAEKVCACLNQVETQLRHVFFEGGRDIPMTRAQREALFCKGLSGLVATVPTTQKQGLWRAFHEYAARDLPMVERQGSLPATRAVGLDGLLGDEGFSRDSQIGSIGGGNHFVELQRVERILDSTTAYAWGLKVGLVTIMVHTGSVSVGHLCGGYSRDLVRRIYPQGMKHPENGVFVLPDTDRFQPEIKRFWDALHNAANFAHVNRLFLALMALESLRAVVGETDMRLVYDAAHNLVWREQTRSGARYLHRKGACPARGMDAMSSTPFAFYGEPVLVPGSMGAPSYVLAGLGNEDALSSASHGAGRALSRGEALKIDEDVFARFLQEFRVVTPVDFRRTDVRQRRDIVEKKLEDIKKEAPFAYKGIGPVIRTLTDAGIARPVAELRPILTLKG